MNEQVCTGTEMIISPCLEQGLKEPECEQNEYFKVVFLINAVDDNEDNSFDGEAGGQIGGQIDATFSQTAVSKQVSDTVSDTREKK